MGSREEFFSAVKLVRDKKIQPVVDSVLSGLGEAEKGFQLLKEGGQFGKVCRLRASEVLQLGGVAEVARLLFFRPQIAIEIAQDERAAKM